MKPIKLMAAALAATLCVCGAASAGNTGYMKLPDIAGESKRAAVGGAQTTTIGANRSETIKGGEAVIVAALWNGKDAPPAKGRPGTANLTLKRGMLSQSFARLKAEQREIPSLTLTLGEGRSAVEYKLERVFVKSWSTSGDADDRPTEEVAFYYNKISF